MGPDVVVCLRYHVWWPSSGDPFYQYNTSESTARTNYYGVSGVPDLWIDGVLSPVATSESQIVSAIGQRRAIEAPCTIDVSTFAGGTTIQVTARVTAEVDMYEASNRLFLALLHRYYTHQSTVYWYPFRDMEPSTAGQTFLLDEGDTFEYEAEFSTQPEWDLGNMMVIAFVQNISTHEVLQAGYTDVDIAYSMDLSASSAHTRMVPPTSTALFIAILTNMGVESDTYTVTVSGDLPSGWTRTIEEQGHPPDPSTISVSLDSYASATIIVRMDPQGHPGTADIAMSAVSQTVPELTGEVDFVMLSGLDVLVVDDDEGQSFEQCYLAALEPLSGELVSGCWDVTYNVPSADDLSQVGCVVWLTGSATTNTLDESEQTKLADYLDAGGRLFVSGQGIGFDIGHPDPGEEFFTDYLHADFIQPFSEGRTVYGVIDDPISDGMSFDIYGGECANNQTRQADIDPLDDAATGFLTYTSGSFERNAALRIETANYRAVYLAFGFEAIADEYNRDLLMANILDWLGVESAVEPEGSVSPLSFSLGSGYPNPFNPVVTIPFTLGEHSLVKLSVFDLLGREVAVLVSGARGPGAYTARWDGSALPSGVYFSRLTVGSEAHPSFAATRKLILLK
jgi:hypothetical protein